MSVRMKRRKRIALIAHDNRKTDLLEWARYNRGTLARHELFATGTTGARLSAELDLHVTRFLSGPLGSDEQIGAGVAEGEIVQYQRLSRAREGPKPPEGKLEQEKHRRTMRASLGNGKRRRKRRRGPQPRRPIVGSKRRG